VGQTKGLHIGAYPPGEYAVGPGFVGPRGTGALPLAVAEPPVFQFDGSRLPASPSLVEQESVGQSGNVSLHGPHVLHVHHLASDVQRGRHGHHHLRTVQPQYAGFDVVAPGVELQAVDGVGDGEGVHGHAYALGFLHVYAPLVPRLFHILRPRIGHRIQPLVTAALVELHGAEFG